MKLNNLSEDEITKGLEELGAHFGTFKRGEGVGGVFDVSIEKFIRTGMGGYYPYYAVRIDGPWYKYETFAANGKAAHSSIEAFIKVLPELGPELA